MKQREFDSAKMSVKKEITRWLTFFCTREDKEEFLGWVRDYLTLSKRVSLEKAEDLLPYDIKSISKMLGQKDYTAKLCENCDQFPTMETTPYCEVCRDELEERFQQLFSDDETNPPFICGA
jgi:hypothetical protein